MNEQEQLKLQAGLDGELTDREMAEVAGWLECRPEARQLKGELDYVRTALRGNELERTLVSSREFYWNRIAAAIEKPSAETVADHHGGFVRWILRHLGQVAGVAAALALLFFTFTSLDAEPLPESDWKVLDPNTGMANYRDYKNGVTVVMLYDRSTPGFTPGN